ncbi:Kinesin-like protein, partial [Armadillidium vulgare]
NHEGIVTLHPAKDALCFVNGREVTELTILKTGSRVILGKNHVFRFNHPEQVRERRGTKSPAETPGSGEPADWQFAQFELLEKHGVDLKEEMQKRLVALDEQYMKEKEEAEKQFEKERQNYEARIDALQRQVEEQSMTMSMYSSYTAEEFTHDEDIFVSLKLFNNVGTQCNISYRKSFDKGIQCNYTGVIEICNISYRESFEKGIQCNFPAKSIGIQCSSNTSNTPRKIRLRKEVHRKACHIKYLKVRNASLKSTLRMMKCQSSNLTENDVKVFCNDHLPILTSEIIKTQLSRKQQWSGAMKNLCLTIYLKSPRTYKFLRTILKLPSTDTLIFEGQKMITSRFRFVGGWIQAINGVQLLLQELKAFNFQYIYTRRLCQDPLENCFGSGGWSDNPTCSQFESLFKRAAVNSLVKISTLKNCEDDDSHNFLSSGLININDCNVSNNDDYYDCNVSNNDNCNVPLSSKCEIFFHSTRLGDENELNGMRYVCTVCDLTSVSNILNDEYLFTRLKQYEHLPEKQGFNQINITSSIVNKIKNELNYKFCCSHIENFALKNNSYFLTLGRPYTQYEINSK